MKRLTHTEASRLWQGLSKKDRAAMMKTPASRQIIREIENEKDPKKKAAGRRLIQLMKKGL